MKFKILSVEDSGDQKKYSCIFSNDLEEKNIDIFIGAPEIETANSILNIIAATCKAEFGGDGGFIDSGKSYVGVDEITADWVECV